MRTQDTLGPYLFEEAHALAHSCNHRRSTFPSSRFRAYSFGCPVSGFGIYLFEEAHALAHSRHHRRRCFRLDDSGFTGFKFQVSGFGFRISGPGCGFWVPEFGFGASGFGFRAYGFGLRVSGCTFLKRHTHSHTLATTSDGLTLPISRF